MRANGREGPLDGVDCPQVSPGFCREVVKGESYASRFFLRITQVWSIALETVLRADQPRALKMPNFSLQAVPRARS